MRYRELLRESERILAAAGVPDPAVDAWYLLERISGMTRAQYYMREGETVPEETARQMQDWVALRADRVPLQHILGDTEFMGLPFLVNRHVLVPRQDTEILVEEALAWAAKRPLRALDVGTGSGCIAVSLACLGNFASVTAVDLSPEALIVARENAERNGAQVRFVVSDLLHALRGETYDLIVSNPPYIPSGEIAGLMPEVRDHDPRLALDGGPDGLACYRRLVREAWEHLAPGGRLMMEIGSAQARAVDRLLEEAGYGGCAVYRDLAGRDRVVAGTKE